MRKRFLYGAGVVLLIISATLVIWQGSFSFGEFGPTSSQETFLYWAVSTLVFLLTVTLGFILFRTGVKLYVERRSGREGSRIRTKLVLGALALSFIPVFFLVLPDSGRTAAGDRKRSNPDANSTTVDNSTRCMNLIGQRKVDAYGMTV